MTDYDPLIDEDPGDLIASIGQRIAARLLDWMLLMTFWLLLGGATSQRLEDDSLSFARWAIILWMAVVVVYESGFVAWRGQTLGKMAMSIELVSLKDGGRLSFAAALSRVTPVAFAMALLGSFFPIILVFVYFSAAFMKNSRGVLDLLAGSVVIQARKASGLKNL